jgi:hypothetical protein
MDIINKKKSETHTESKKKEEKRSKDSPRHEIPVLESQNNALKKIIEKLKSDQKKTCD